MSVPRGTTPTFQLIFTKEGLDLTEAHNVYVTFKSGVYTITKSGEDLTVGEKNIGVYLEQDETLKFSTPYIEIQANWTTVTGNRAASEVVEYPISKQLLLKVIE